MIVSLGRVTFLALSLMTAPVSAQVVLSPAEMQELAGQAVLQGQASLGYGLASALIGRDPNDIHARLIRSRAARNLGKFDEALSDARAAWTLSQTDQERYVSALAQAQALSSSGRRTAAQLWLRRAVQLAPDNRSKAIAARDFQYVRGQNPWATYLSFSVSPSSNINNGSRNETSQLFDLPFEFSLEGKSRALSGVEIAAGINTRYRLRQSQSVRSDLVFALRHQNYTLSDDAKEIAPDAKGSDFASTNLSFGLRETYLLPDGKTQLGWSGTLGSNWYGGDPLYDMARGGLTARYRLSARSMVQAGASREVQWGKNDRRDARIWSANIGYAYALENGGRLSLGLTYSRSESEADFLDYDTRGLNARYRKAKPVGPVNLEFGVFLSEKTHEGSALSADGREERSLGGDVTFVFKDVDYYGFVPTVTLNAKTTESNIGLYEADEFGVKLGIRSAF